MKLREIISAFAAIEKDLYIDEPAFVEVNAVYPYLPPARDVINTPCFMHQWRPAGEKRHPNGLRQRDYILRVQMLVARIGVDTDYWSEVAAAFDDVIVSAFDEHVKLGDRDTYQRSQGEEEFFQPSAIEWNGVSYVGLQYDYLVTVYETVLVAA